jgi:hypothetical protein
MIFGGSGGSSGSRKSRTYPARTSRLIIHLRVGSRLNSGHAETEFHALEGHALRRAVDQLMQPSGGGTKPRSEIDCGRTDEWPVTSRQAACSSIAARGSSKRISSAIGRLDQHVFGTGAPCLVFRAEKRDCDAGFQIIRCDARTQKFRIAVNVAASVDPKKAVAAIGVEPLDSAPLALSQQSPRFRASGRLRLCVRRPSCACAAHSVQEPLCGQYLRRNAAIG